MDNTTEQSAAELIEAAIAKLKTEPEFSMKFVNARAIKDLLDLALEKIEEDRENMLDQERERDLYD
jgi:hypothetical protein